MKESLAITRGRNESLENQSRDTKTELENLRQVGRKDKCQLSSDPSFHIVLVWPTCQTPPYCSAHDEWLIMKLCMYVGYHTVNNVSNFGGDSVTQLNF